MEGLCAWCEAPKQQGSVCPACGADYAKAEAIRNTGRASVAPIPEDHSTTAPAQDTAEPTIPVRDPAFEMQVCLFALPAMLFIAMMVQVTGFMAGLQRIIFGMPVHELGHAITGWLCGFNSIPTLWKTITPENRGYLSSILIIAGLVALVRYAFKNRQTTWLVVVALIFVVQLYGTFGVTLSEADIFITMGGDALGLVLATALMALFYVGKDTQLYKGSLRWGFLAIGAAAFMDIYTPWWNKDISAIGYGLIGGIPTDSWKMINIHFWDWNALFNTHIYLGIACLLFLATVYGLGLKQAGNWIKEKEHQDRLARLRAS